MRRILTWMLILLVLMACDKLPPEPDDPGGSGLSEVAPLFMSGWAREVRNGGVSGNMDADGNPSDGLDVRYELGGVGSPPAPNSIAVAEAYATASGKTFWVSAEAPTMNGPEPEAAIGGTGGLFQYWRFRKDSPTATLRFVVTAISLHLFDGNSAAINTREVCPWGWSKTSVDARDICRDAQQASIDVFYDASSVDSVRADGTTFLTSFFLKSARVAIVGFSDESVPLVSVGTGTGGGRSLFALDDFEIDNPAGYDRYRRMLLRSPMSVDIPLDTLPVGAEFDVLVYAEARAWTRRRNEAYVAAYFRDPAGSSGLGVETDGLSMIPSSMDPARRVSTLPAAPPCTVAGPRSTIQFESAEYFVAEWPGDPGHVAQIAVTRSGDSGEASALLTTSGGTATAGSRGDRGVDYSAEARQVRFAAGETGTRMVVVPIIGDADEEDDETVMLTLSDPQGCAGLGGRSNATLTIWDDDGAGTEDDGGRTIGGTVDGLEGSGLVLTNNSTDDLPIDAEGSFQFDREYADGFIYNVRVDRQPTDPAQSCTVSNGSGTVAGADITDIQVRCETLTSTGEYLDPGFGSGGRVTLDVRTTGTLGDAADVARQDDGKLVVVSGNSLARYSSDGSLDGGFGAGGVVTVEFYGSRDRLNAVDIQPDGRILVAGYSQDGVNSPVQEDFILARYQPDGTLDPSFGVGGKVITDFDEHQDIAYDLLVQPDGRIVVVGIAATIDSLGFGVYTPDFAIARYTDDGQLDEDFGEGGKVTTNIAGQTDLGYAVALQPDGKILLAGRAAASGGANPDIGVVRYNPDGSLDASFGSGGILRRRTTIWDEAADVVVQPDGRIVVVGFTLHEGGLVSPAPDTLTVERYEQDGSYDPTFGDGGRVQTALISPGRAVSLQPDGSMIVVGVEQSGESADWAITRLTPQGEVDTSFGAEGLIRVDFYGGLDIANELLLEPGGAVVVVGSVTNGASNQLGLIRVLP